MAVRVKQHKGAWWIFINHKGKRKAKKVGSSKRAADEVAGKIEAKLKLGDFSLLDEKTHRPFDTYYRNWLETYVKAHCKERTYDLYADAFRVHLETIRKLPGSLRGLFAGMEVRLGHRLKAPEH